MNSVRTKTLGLIALLVVVFYFAKECHTAVEALGCKFEDDKYTIAKDATYSGRVRAPMKFTNNQNRKDVYKMGPFETDLIKTFEEVITTSVQNDWDPFIDFIKAYKQERATKGRLYLSDFFHNYQRPFHPRQDAASLVIAIYNEMKKNYPKIADYFYMIRVFYGTKEDFEMNKESYKVNPNHAFVAGALKVLVDFAGADKPGVIIIDPRLTRPVHLQLETYGFFSNEYILYQGGFKELPEMHTFTWNNNSNLLFADVTVPFDTDFTRNAQGKSQTEFRKIYDLSKPHCDFMETMKQRILHAEHTISTKRKKSGELAQTFAYFTFNLQHFYNLELPFIRFKGYARDEESDANAIKVFVKQFKKEENEEITDENKENIDKICQKLFAKNDKKGENIFWEIMQTGIAGGSVAKIFEKLEKDGVAEISEKAKKIANIIDEYIPKTPKSKDVKERSITFTLSKMQADMLQLSSNEDKSDDINEIFKKIFKKYEVVDDSSETAERKVVLTGLSSRNVTEIGRRISAIIDDDEPISADIILSKMNFLMENVFDDIELVNKIFQAQENLLERQNIHNVMHLKQNYDFFVTSGSKRENFQKVVGESHLGMKKFFKEKNSFLRKFIKEILLCNGPPPKD